MKWSALGLPTRLGEGILVSDLIFGLILADAPRTPICAAEHPETSHLDFGATRVAVSKTAVDPLHDKAGRLLELVDSVYFLLFPGWENELRSNRWHFAVRWARVKPVVLLDPTGSDRRASSMAELRIPNCRVLRIESVDDPMRLATGQFQLGQVLADMSEHNFERPLLWCYNTNLVGLFARLPGVARVHHATEAYFDMPGIDSGFQRRVQAAVAISDLTVAVSDGVAAALRGRVPGAEIVTISNGCDFRHYSAGRPDAELKASAQAYSRVAIYAGNVNYRVDFDLLGRLVEEHPDVLFAFYGPSSSVTGADKAAWEALISRKNVAAPGPVNPDRLPDLYAAADIGIIPFRQDRLLVENGFPLKALEMCATGLPVVSTLMKPLVGIAEGLVVTPSSDEFVAAFERTSRAGLSAPQVDELRTVSAANDYDIKFDQVLTQLEVRVNGSRPATRVDVLIDALGRDWFAAEMTFARWLARPLLGRNVSWLVAASARIVPKPLRRLIASKRLRAAVRENRGS
jgi:glycosyl transferase family 1